MSLTPGTRLGPYEIAGPLGAGGMGEVYRARDTRLGRTVALKTVRSDVAGDPARRRRLEREAKAVAALNHPHICTLYDVGEHHDGSLFLVMEVVEGEPLSARLARGPLPPADVLTCAIQIADALDQAHRQGVVHRDLKPANIMLAHGLRGADRTLHVTLLDFGLASLRDEALVAEAPTLTQPLTEVGQVLGTLPYMAPEQIEGRGADARSDIFAFGVVVLEMATGRRAFDGPTAASLAAAVLGTPPPALATVQPRALARLLEVCLARDPEARWSSMHDVLLQLRSMAADEPASTPSTPTRQGPRPWAVALPALAAGAVLAVLAFPGRGGDSTADGVSRTVSVLPPANTRLVYGEAPQISPDGRRLVLVARAADGTTGLYLRELDEAAPRLLSGTEGAVQPFWAPDSRRLGFFADGQVKAVTLGGGPPLALAPAPVPRGGTWNQHDDILFVAVPNRAPLRVPATGGDAAPVPTAGEDDALRWFPRFLPDGRHYLFVHFPLANRARGVVSVASIDSTEKRQIISSTASAEYATPGHLLFRRDGALMAQPFDVSTFALGGSPVVVASEAGFNAITYRGLFSASATGTVAIQEPTPGSQLTWFDRQGRRLEPATPPGDQNNFCLTYDGTRIVYEASDPATGNVDLWVADLTTHEQTRLTFDPAIDFYPVCSPVGHEVVFASLRDGPPSLYRLSLDAPGSETPLPRLPAAEIPTDWSRNGRLLIHSVLSPQMDFDVYTLSLEDGTRTPVAATRAEERNARLSPDGHWIAYVSNEGGAFDVYVQPFPPTGARWQVSRGGGMQPVWSAEGGGLYYLRPDRSLVRVEVTVRPQGIAFGDPTTLMQLNIDGWEPVNLAAQYAVTADGSRVLAATAAADVRAVTLVLDWQKGGGR
jgi:serine/threonine protein kinase/Tol biopolymer transport system component